MLLILAALLLIHPAASGASSHLRPQSPASFKSFSNILIGNGQRDSQSLSRGEKQWPKWFETASACPCEQLDFNDTSPHGSSGTVGKTDLREDSCAGKDVAAKIWNKMNLEHPANSPSALRDALFAGPPTTTLIIMAGDSTGLQQIRSFRCLMHAISGTCGTSMPHAASDRFVPPNFLKIKFVVGRNIIHFVSWWGRYLFPQKKFVPGSRKVSYEGSKNKKPCCSVLVDIEKVIKMSKIFQNVDRAFIVPMVGAWYNNVDAYESDLKKLSPWWLALKRDVSGWENSKQHHLILREPLPQHFQSGTIINHKLFSGHDGNTGVFTSQVAAKKFHCGPITSDDFRQRSLKKMTFDLAEGNVNILPVYENMRDLWYAHPSHGKGRDCTHYCVAAVYWWNAELMYMIQSLSERTPLGNVPWHGSNK